MAQAACIDAARAAWQAAGVTVAVACPSELSARRWRALTSLRSPASGSYTAGYQSSSSRQKRVLVVDAADHLSPSILAGLLQQASATRTKVVLVPGGTVPGNGPSLAHSLDHLLEQLSAAGPSLADAGAPQLLGRPAHPAVSVPGIVVQGSLTGTDAMGHVVAAWAGVARSGAFPPLMVAFGPAEAEALNRSARAVQWELRGQRGSGGSGGRPRWRREYREHRKLPSVSGDMPLVNRCSPCAVWATSASATTGTVVALGPRSVSIEWHLNAGAWRSEVGADHAPSLGYGYATTVPYLRSCEETGRDLLVLGDPLELGSRSVRARSAWVAVPGPGLPLVGLAAVSARHRAAVAELATSWPDSEMLDRVGPRPLDDLGRRRWAERLASSRARPRPGDPPRRLHPHCRHSARAGFSAFGPGAGAMTARGRRCPNGMAKQAPMAPLLAAIPDRCRLRAAGRGLLGHCR